MIAAKHEANIRQYEGTDSGVIQDMFSGEKTTVVIEGKGRINQESLIDWGKVEGMKEE